MYHHPALIQALASDRVAERRHDARAAAAIRPEKHPHRLIPAVRHATGWLLIDLGLRLATARGGRSRFVARAQR